MCVLWLYGNTRCGLLGRYELTVPVKDIPARDILLPRVPLATTYSVTKAVAAVSAVVPRTQSRALMCACECVCVWICVTNAFGWMLCDRNCDE